MFLSELLEKETILKKVLQNLTEEISHEEFRKDLATTFDGAENCINKICEIRSRINRIENSTLVSEKETLSDLILYLEYTKKRIKILHNILELKYRKELRGIDFPVDENYLISSVKKYKDIKRVLENKINAVRDKVLVDNIIDQDKNPGCGDHPTEIGG